MSKNIRDLFTGERPNEIQLQDLVHENPPLAKNHTDVEARLGSRLPGDSLEGHPLGESRNPYLSINPQTTLREIRDGKIPKEDLVLAREAIRTIQSVEYS